MEFEYFLASGLALLIMGISFLWNRINFIKKGNIAIATVVKLEECLDSEDNKYYVPHFKFSHSNKEITYRHTGTVWKYRWRLGEKVKVSYAESFFDNDDILLLTFVNAFGFSTILLTVGIELLIVAGIIYWNVSGHTSACLILGSIAIVPLTLRIWANCFFKNLE